MRVLAVAVQLQTIQKMEISNTFVQDPGRKMCSGYGEDSWRVMRDKLRFRSGSYNNMFEISRKQENRAARRNGEFHERPPRESYSSPKLSLLQIKQKAVQKELAENKANDGQVKQRNKKEEYFCESFPNFIFGKHKYDPELVTRHLKLMHQALLYCSLVLGTPSESYLHHKMLSLPEPTVQKDKILMLDLDETLIHSVKDNQMAEVQLNSSSGMIRFNVRPFCQVFLQSVCQSFQVYVFTSATENYAKTIIDYFNSKTKYIQGFLHRSHCLQTKRGLRIKDLRIIKNRDLSKIVIVDNLVHSFGLQLQNGIPILQFINQQEDKELLGLAQILREVERVEDVRDYLRNKFQLKKCIRYSQELFVQLNYENCQSLKGRRSF